MYRYNLPGLKLIYHDTSLADLKLDRANKNELKAADAYSSLSLGADFMENTFASSCCLIFAFFSCFIIPSKY